MKIIGKKNNLTKLINKTPYKPQNRFGLIFNLEDRNDIINKALKIFSKNLVDISFVYTKLTNFEYGKSKSINFFLDIIGLPTNKNIQNSIKDINSLSSKSNTCLKEIPWFPKSIYDLDLTCRIKNAGDENLTSDHPGFNDIIYRKRRQEIVNISSQYKMQDGINIPNIEYTNEEINLWKYIWDLLIPLHKKHACKEYLESFDEFYNEGIITRDKIPQLSDISNFLLNKTGFIYRPITGMSTAREFLNAFAFRVFYSSQYLRHGSIPIYTPEPDIIHEIIGHGPYLANKKFADFSQLLGIASLGASDEDIRKLIKLYWFTIEFGLCKEDNNIKAYGTGVLSSPKEITNAFSENKKLLTLDVYKAIYADYFVTDVQREYFVADSFKDVLKNFVKYFDNIIKPFNLEYDNKNKEVILKF